MARRALCYLALSVNGVDYMHPLVTGALFEGGSDAPPAVAEGKRPAMRTAGYLADVRLRPGK